MAEGRTRICGRREESIFRKSRGRRPYWEENLRLSRLEVDIQTRRRTLAMSSDFLNSPFTSVTSPFSLTSVHRSFNSLESLPTLLRPSTEPLASSRKLGSGGRSFGLSAEFPFPFFSGHSRLRKDRLSAGN